MGESPDPLAARLAEVRARITHPEGVGLGVMRLPIMDDLLAELEARVEADAPDPVRLSEELVGEIERTVDLLATGMLGTSPEGVGRRFRLVEVLRRGGSGRLPARAFDVADAFGAELADMVTTDPELADALGMIHPLLVRATGVAPSGRWLSDARDLVREAGADRLMPAARRALASLLRADIVSRPDLLIGGVRLVNQRLARGLAWFAAVVLAEPAELLGAIGVRMGTSGRNDAVVRDTAVANSCAALLGASEDPLAAAALATMRVRVTNRNVLKQIDRALEAIAARVGLPVAEVIELALPTFGLDEHGRVQLDVGGATALLELTGDGVVERRWRLADGRDLDAPPEGLTSAFPGEVADIRARIEAIEAAIADERRRMDARMASERSWSEDTWRRRFRDHPIGGHFGRRLIWMVGPEPPIGTAAIPVGEGWRTVDGGSLPVSPASPAGPLRVWLWHPVDAEPEEVVAWRAGLAAAGVEQPIRQADRDLFHRQERDRGLAADRRVAGRIVDHAQMRALLRGRGWAVPSLGSWDQGDEATASRAFDNGLHAELRYQAVDLLPTGARHERARLVAVRFVTAETGPAAAEGTPIALDLVPARVLSEALCDVSLVVVVGEVPPAP